MKPSLFVSAFNPLREVPEVCSLCSSNPPVFRYEFRIHGDNGEPRENKGFCCARCSVGLLKKLGRAESQKWAEEEAALEDDDVDVTDFRERASLPFRTERAAVDAD